jgi:hypothetical protein
MEANSVLVVSTAVQGDFAATPQQGTTATSRQVSGLGCIASPTPVTSRSGSGPASRPQAPDIFRTGARDPRAPVHRGRHRPPLSPKSASELAREIRGALQHLTGQLGPW